MSVKSDILQEIAAQPLTKKQLYAKLEAEPVRIARALRALEAKNKISYENGRYASNEKIAKPAAQDELVFCKIVKLGKSFGFAQPLDGSDDIFVPGRSLRGAMPGDEVGIEVSKHPRVAGSREGAVAVVEKENNRVVGTIEMFEGHLVLVPDNCKDTPLMVRRRAEGNAKVGDKAAGELSRGERHSEHRVIIVMVFGSSDSAKKCTDAILYAADIVKAFPEEVKTEAQSIGSAVLKRQMAGRVDLREAPIFTIDSASTKDIDDAISLQKTSLGYELCVHIADVSYYVQPQSPLDEEALTRGTSVYYADSVVPMLPEELSNGICSLNPNVDRLAFSCMMQFNEAAQLLSYRFVKTVICSKIKGVYSEINQLLAGEADDELTKKYAQMQEQIVLMHELYKKLAKNHKARGAMEIESDEPYLVIDKDGVCIGIEKRTRGVSERMIEEFMLMANTAAAKQAHKAGAPFVYRVHEEPAPDRIEQLKLLLTALGVEYDFKNDIPTTSEYAKLLNNARGLPVERAVHTGVLRSMAKAKYEAEGKGHFGLALEDYAHFTSPIRRYADLIVHRVLGDIVKDAPKTELVKRYKNFVVEASAHITAREIAAQQAERNCDDCYKAEYMRQFIGEEFIAVVASVVPFGIYVALQNTVEGLVHVSRLSPRPMTLVEGVTLTDPGTGKSYRIGDTVKVRLAATDVAHGNIDFDVVEE